MLSVVVVVVVVVVAAVVLFKPISKLCKELFKSLSKANKRRHHAKKEESHES